MGDVVEVEPDPFRQLRRGRNLAAKAFALGQARDARFHPVLGPVGPHLSFEFLVEQRHHRPGTHDAHVSQQHIPELGEFIETVPAEETAKRVDALVVHPGLPHFRFFVGGRNAHRAELQHRKLDPALPGARPGMEKRTRSLPSLYQPNQQDEFRQDEQHHG